MAESPSAAPASDAANHAADALLDAAQEIIRNEGMAAISTRRVAKAAGMPMSQIHYHFGSKRGLVMALLKREDAELLNRQKEMYASDLPLSRKWQRACDYLEEDMRSGYVRILHEMIAAGFSDEGIAEEMRRQLKGWYGILKEVCSRAEEEFSSIGPFTAEELAALVGQCFLGIEIMLLLDMEEARTHGLGALRKVGLLIEAAEAEGARP